MCANHLIGSPEAPPARPTFLLLPRKVNLGQTKAGTLSTSCCGSQTFVPDPACSKFWIRIESISESGPYKFILVPDPDFDPAKSFWSLRIRIRNTAFFHRGSGSRGPVRCVSFHAELNLPLPPLSQPPFFVFYQIQYIPLLVDSTLGLSYRPASLCSLTGRYDNPMSESTLSPIRGLWIWLQGYKRLSKDLNIKFPLIIWFSFCVKIPSGVRYPYVPLYTPAKGIRGALPFSERICLSSAMSESSCFHCHVWRQLKMWPVVLRLGLCCPHLWDRWPACSSALPTRPSSSSWRISSSFPTMFFRFLGLLKIFNRLSRFYRIWLATCQNDIKFFS